MIYAGQTSARQIIRLVKSSKDVILAQQMLSLSANMDIWIAF